MDDAGHVGTDAILAEMEKKIARVYKQASKEAEEKLDDYLRRFAIKDATWQRRVAAGEATAAEYAQWRIGQIMMGKRWEEMRNSLAQDYHNANLIARSVVTGYMPEVYALNHNYGTFQVEQGGRVDTSYTLYSRETVERILRDDPDLLPGPGPQMKNTFALWDAYRQGENIELTEAQKKAFDNLIASGKDLRWQEGQIQSVMLQGILQGESIPNLSRRVADTMGEINHKSTIRYARTAATAAQNAGRQDAYRRAEALGVDMVREWRATLDMRTRHEHRVLDGQQRGVDEPFEMGGYEIMYPGEPSAPAHLIWNCRCTLIPRVSGWESRTGKLRDDSKIEGMSYEEWKENHDEKPHPITKQEKIAEAERRRYIRELYGGKGGGGGSAPAAQEPRLGHSGDAYTKGQRQNLENLLANADPLTRAVYNSYSGGMQKTVSEKGIAYYSPVDSTVHMSARKQAAGDSLHPAYQTHFHEFGHNIDNLAGRKATGQKYYFGSYVYKNDKGETFTEIINREWDSKFQRKDGTFDGDAYDNYVSRIRQNYGLQARGDLSDMLEPYAVAHGKPAFPLGAGHGKAYASNSRNSAVETFAEMMSAEVANAPSLDLIKSELPEAYAEYRNMLWGML